MEVSVRSMAVGSIVYFLPFFFVLNPALVLQGNMWESLYLTANCALGTLAICGGIQGALFGLGNLRNCGAFEWPARILLVIGGIVYATPGGGIMPLKLGQMELLGLAILVPTISAVWIRTRSRKLTKVVGYQAAEKSSQ